MKRRLLVALVVLAVVAGTVYGGAHLLTDRSALARAIAWGESDVGDQFRFPSRRIAAGGEAAPLPEDLREGLLDQPVPGEDRSWAELFSDSDTLAVAVVHDDRLVLEWYADGVSREDRQTSFSAAKSFVSTLVGIAVDQGLIGSVDDPVTTYLPELAERDERFERVTLRHLLTMSSGIHYEEHGLPWSDDALTYYATDMRDLALEHTEIDDAPGEEWVYNNYHPLLLGLVLERVAGTSVSEFMSTHLWQLLGAEADASWSLDSEDSGFEKMESGINARPLDFARFGQLMLHEGRWNGRRIVSEDWVREATAQSKETDPVDYYQYLWWVDDGWFSARGKYGQYVAVFPERDTVVVRMGSDDEGVDWPATLTQLAEVVDEER